ncbi:MAG TPA: helicase-related protein, partial [Candidatus Saccharimonadales bacterium]|nr:helicase-related protein [Candidatus Saccharimonadales bacterium]
MTSRTVENNDVTSEFVKVVSESWPEQVYIDNDGNLQTIPERYEYRLGDNTQPVARYREHIVTTVSENLLTIITAKTGGGKSSNIPQYLFESGLFDKIAITQPRVVAARQLSEYVDKQIAKYINDDEHNLVGYQTAVEGKSSESNAILYVTDGLQLMREISKNGIQKNQVLVIDEYHERSGNMDALLAIAVEYGIRTVVMSATLDAKDLSEHYGEVIGEKVPIIDIPGANYEVNERESSDLDKEVIAAANQGKNILVFLPGRKEINSAMGRLRRRLPSSYTLLALHGDQTPEEQGRVFPSYPGGKIIFSTSVGQTSITIDDIDTVIDCGYERTQTLGDNGKYTLATQQSSRATADQRRGRVGRTKDGEYIRAQLRGFPPLSSISETDAYDTPAIKRTRSEDLQLKLAAFDHSMDSLPFYELPDEQEITRGRERLARLGLFKKLGQTALDGFAITERGKRAARLPLDVYSARMVLESRKYGAAVELQMMAAAAVQQIKGITHTAKGMENWRKLTSESESDIIAGIDFMVAAMKRTEKEQESSHIVELRFKKSFRAFEQLAARRHLDVYDLTAPDDEQRELLKKSIVAGTDEIFIKSGLHAYKDSHGKKRQPVSSTIIQSGHELLSGSSFNLQQVRHKKIATHALISAASSVTIDTLREVVP